MSNLQLRWSVDLHWFRSEGKKFVRWGKTAPTDRKDDVSRRTSTIICVTNVSVALHSQKEKEKKENHIYAWSW